MRVLRKLLSPLRNPPSDSAFDGVGTSDSIAVTPSSSNAIESVIREAAEHAAAGRYSASLVLIDGALEVAPRDANLRVARASTLFASGRFIEARNAFVRSAQNGTLGADALIKLGWSCLWAGDLEQALGAMRTATAMQPDDWSAHFGAATVLRAQKKLAASIASFERALALQPTNAYCLSNLVACEIDLGHLDGAEGHARRALDIDASSASAWSDLGMVLCEQERFDEAISAFEHAQTIEAAAGVPDDVVNFAICLLRGGRTQRALALLERNLPLNPSGTGHSQYALALLIAGRLREGFDQYEFRWLEPPLSASRARFGKPAWTGQDLRGKTILLRAEQGFGDFIQFSRYVPHVKRLGATLLLMAREELRELAEALDGVDCVLKPSEPCPPCDFYANLLSLPRVFGSEVNSIPADVPYLRTDPRRTTAWAGKFEGERRLKVGLVWAGSPTHLRDRFRSLSLQQLAPLLNVDGVRIYSLQKGPAAAALAKIVAPSTIVDLGSELETFADTAAAISHLDLVIGVDTAVVHVAGALGKPVWTLVPTPCDWRWLEDRDDSPWYPTMRLFRQRAHGDWAEVIRGVTAALESRAHERNFTAPAAHAASFVSLPSLTPSDEPIVQAVPGLSSVAETRMGIVQYFRDQPDVGEAIEAYGEWLQAQLELLTPLVKSGMVAMEVGAGIGIHALALSRAVGAQGHLLVYEDDPRRRQVLKQNLAANDANNVTVMRRSLRRHTAGFDAAQHESIDDLRLERLDWLKISESPGSPHVLLGAADTLWRLRPGLFIAGADQQAMNDASLQLKEFGYRCWLCKAPMFNRDNFNHREYDSFVGRVSWALLALPEESAVSMSEGPYVFAQR